MNVKPYLPDVPAVVRETLVVLLGALLAAAIAGQFPKLKQWMRDQWQQ